MEHSLVHRQSEEELFEREHDFLKYQEMLKQMHPDFIKQLLRKAPDLTPNEIRVCELTRLHFHVKEVATILHRAVSTIETHRSNARSKLGVSPNQNFVSVLHSI